MIDVTEQVNAVRRQVGRRRLEAGEARVATVSQTYKATVEDVWEACTDAERIARWFLPVSGELRLGGRYQIEGNAGGIIEACEPPRRFAATWEFGGQMSWIEVRLSPEGDDRTRFELEHVAHVDDSFWKLYGPAAVGIGWDQGLIGLTMYLSTGAGLSPEEGAAWQQSEEGRRFAALSGQRWAEAAVADGADADEARAAAERTIAMYTGEAEGPDEG